MNTVFVAFTNKNKTVNPNSKVYEYASTLDFIRGGVYDIVADNVTTYNNSVVIVDCIKGASYNSVRKITDAKLIKAPKKPDGDVKHIHINEKKKIVTIVWKSGGTTMVKCHPEDEFDAEKGIAMCFMKKAFKNRGCFNDVIKKYLGEEIWVI